MVLFYIWTKPRATIRKIVDTDPNHQVILLASLYGITNALSNITKPEVLGLMPIWGFLLLAVIVGPILGIIGLYIGSALLHLTGRWIGGTASRQHLRTAIAWAMIPNIFAIPIILLMLLIFVWFESNNVQGTMFFAVSLIIIGISMIILGFWSMIILLKCVGEVQGFSAWKALGNSILAFLIVFVPIFLVMIFVIFVFSGNLT
ncbi:membrane protein containing Yip1 domain protein [Candidatus Thiomargarita nelsonii]|uniref:Membrane protein containing Yip1 domain protein n=1 Tax=Candidatus Thiomargarita nelsonii TaxID=1003181 RepID=A0A176RX72_9GAMM|nr:membrane protein containing Yip1 domain protein [Candidatus Thiomargarita nelsonii]